MRTNWLTLATVGTLAAFGSITSAQEDPQHAPADSPPAVSDSESLDRARSQILLHKANAELQEGHYHEARQLAKEAAALSVAYTLFDIRPEQVLAEIDRKETNALNARRWPQKAAEPAPRVSRPTEPPVPAVSKQPATGAAQWDFDAPTASPPPTTLPEKKPITQKLPATENPFLEAPVAAPQSAPTKPPSQQVTSDHSSVPADSTSSNKKAAIQLLNRGLLALEQHRFEEAAAVARQAIRMHVAWDPYDYRPENLLKDIELNRAALEPSLAKPEELAPARFPTPVATDPVTQDRVSQNVLPASAPGFSGEQRTPNLSEPPRPVPASNPPISSATAKNPAALAAASQPGHESGASSRAEGLLEEAIGDLHDGHDEMARLRVERALRLMRNSAQFSAPPAASSGAGMGNALFGSIERPSAVSAAAVRPDSYFRSSSASHSDPSRMPPNSSGIKVADEASMKPLHDPFLGDDPISTKASTAGEQRMVESTPRTYPTRPFYPPRRATSSAQNQTITQAAYESSAPLYNGGASSVGKADGSSSAGSTDGASSGGPRDVSTPRAQAAALRSSGYDHGTNAAPIAPPVTLDPSWAKAGRTPYAPSSSADASVPAGSQQPQEQPGIFRRAWNAMTGQ